VGSVVVTELFNAFIEPLPEQTVDVAQSMAGDMFN
jgi:hypothetical protein